MDESEFARLDPQAQQAAIAAERAQARRYAVLTNTLIFLSVIVSFLAFFYIRNRNVIAVYGLQRGLALGMSNHFRFMAPLFGLDAEYAWGVVSAVNAAYQTNTQCHFSQRDYDAVGNATAQGESLCKGLTCACFINNHATARAEAIAELAFSALMTAVAWISVIFTAGASLPGAIAATAFFGASTPSLVKTINQRATVFGSLYCPDECCYTPEGQCLTSCPGQLPSGPCK
jgi:hypothetical protein